MILKRQPVPRENKSLENIFFKIFSVEPTGALSVPAGRTEIAKSPLPSEYEIVSRWKRIFGKKTGRTEASWMDPENSKG